MPKLPYVDGKSCCTISVKNTWKKNCGNCDNCLNPKKQVEAKELLSAVLEVISTLKEKFKADYIVNILVGNETSEIQNYKHNELEVFGSGQDEDDKTWNAVIRQV